MICKCLYDVCVCVCVVSVIVKHPVLPPSGTLEILFIIIIIIFILLNVHINLG